MSVVPFNRNERKGILFLLILALLVIGALTYINYKLPASGKTGILLQGDSILINANDSVKGRQGRRYENSSVPSTYQSWRKELVSYHRFDPNEADSLELRSLGIPPYSVHSILQYRRHGGHFRKATDVARIYTLDSTVFHQIEPYIVLPQEASVDVRDTTSRPAYPIQEKLRPGTRIDLNRADTSELKMIPGIGSTLAQRIVRHRQQLGGFISMSQLAEIHLDTTRLSPWFHIDKSAIQPIRVNHTTLQQLCRHPYINYYQAKAIMNYERTSGPIHSLKIFRLLEEFTDEDIQRISSYLDFQ